MPKTANTPYPAYQASGWVGGEDQGPQRVMAGTDPYTGLPVYEYPGLYQLYGFASSPSEAYAMYTAAHHGTEPQSSADSFERQAMLWTAGFVGGFSLAGFGAASWAGLGAAGAGLGTRVGVAIGIGALSSVSQDIVTQSFSSELGAAYTSGSTWGAIAGITFNILSSFVPSGVEGLDMTTTEVMADVQEQATITEGLGGEFYEPAIGNPGMPRFEPQEPQGGYPGFWRSLGNYLNLW